MKRWTWDSNDSRWHAEIDLTCWTTPQVGIYYGRTLDISILCFSLTVALGRLR